nr:hypothetical protein [Tanacetum cinerariifolium]
KTRADSINAGGSGSASTRGSADVQGCLYKTFMNCKPHSFNETKGVVGLKRWFEKMEQVFEICKCTEDDKGRATRIGESNKRKWEDHQRNTNNNNPNNNNNNRNRNNNHQQQQNRRQETARVYAVAPAEGRGYAGNLRRCNHCNSHHNGQCPPKCRKCQITGHQEKDCRQNPNVVAGTFLLNNHYACILFDSGAEKSFVSSAFTPFIDIAPTSLNTSYEVELADGKV